MDLLCRIVDLSPDERKICGAGLKGVALLCKLSDGNVVHASVIALRSIGFAVRNHPESVSVLLHSAQIYYYIARMDFKLCGAHIGYVLLRLLKL